MRSKVETGGNEASRSPVRGNICASSTAKHTGMRKSSLFFRWEEKRSELPPEISGDLGRPGCGCGGQKSRVIGESNEERSPPRC